MWSGIIKQELFNNQNKIEQEAKRLYQSDKKQVRQFLTDYAIEWGDTVVERAWRLGDELWTKYDEKF